jgi:Spy/CpxP family protein refolding chaperone
MQPKLTAERKGEIVMKKWLLLIVVVAMVAVPALAGEPMGARVLEQTIAVEGMEGEDGPPAHPRAKEAIVQFLALTEDQVAQWDALLAARKEAVAPVREELRATEEQLKALLQSENPDAGAIGTLVLAGKSLREGIAAAHKDYVVGFEALLTPEQKGKLGAIRRAARLAPLVPAFGAFGLVAPPGR